MKYEMVRIEKSDRVSTPYQVLLGDLVVALCPSEFTANLVGGALSFRIAKEEEMLKKQGNLK